MKPHKSILLMPALLAMECAFAQKSRYPLKPLQLLNKA